MRWVSLIVCALLLAPGLAWAEALPFRATVRVGRPAAAVTVSVARGDDGVALTLRGAGPAVQRSLETDVTDVSIEEIALAGQARVALVRMRGASGVATALVGATGRRPAILWMGADAPRGDLGERTTAVIETEDRTGDGVPDVIVGIDLESSRICGQARTLLDPHAVEPRTLALQPVTLRRLPEGGGDEIEVVATRQSPGPTDGPLVRGLQFHAASSSLGSPREPNLVPPPLALSDGDRETLWAEGHPGPGRWEFASGRWSMPGGIRAVALTLGPPRESLGVPRHLWLVGDQGPRVHVTIPADVLAGERVWVVPPAPLAWRCVSIVLDDGDAGALALAEVEGYGDIDFGEGLARVVEELVSDGERGARSADLLSRAGPRGLAVLLEAWPTLTATGKRRGLRVLAAHVESDAAMRALGEAATDDDVELREAAFEALARLGDAGEPTLFGMLAEPGDVSDRAALLLSQLAPDDAAVRLLTLLQRDGGSERPLLRRALAQTYRRGSAETRAHFTRWEASRPPVASLASLLLGLARLDEARPAATDMAARAIESAESFEDRYRLAAAASELGASEPIDAWLAAQARDAEEWMMRATAVAALARRGAPNRARVATRALRDDYPRVRLAAVAALAEDRGSLEALSALARRDRWPMVRARAVESLGAHEAASAVVLRALDDDAQSVRAAALRALTTSGRRDAEAAVAARLADEDEWPEVLAEAIAYAKATCATGLVEPLGGLVRRGMRPDAWAPDVDAAVLAIEALGVIGGEDAYVLLRRASGAEAPPPLRAAAARARRGPPRCEGTRGP